MKSNKFIIGFIAGVVVALLVGLSFYAGTKYSEQDKKEEKIEKREEPKKEEKKEEIKSEELSLDSKIVKDAAAFLPITDCHGYDIELTAKDRKLNDLSDKEKLAITAAYLSKDLSFDNVPDDEYDGEVHKEIKESDVKKLFEDTSFLDALKKEKDNSYSIGFNSIFIENGKYYVNLIASGCTASEYEDDHLSLVKAEREGDKLILTYGYAYFETKFDEKINNFMEYYYKTKGDKTPLVKKSNTKTPIKDWSKFNKYEFVFDISDDNLRIQEINFIEVK